MPETPWVHLFLARGNVELGGAGQLAEGDTVWLTGIGGQSVTAVEPAEILVWEIHTTIRT